MAWSAHSDPEQIKELYDSQAKLAKDADRIVEIINNSKHLIFFTGAGISTSAGIPDFRGPDGEWTLQAQGRIRRGKTTDTLNAIPTPTHMAIKKLLELGKAKYLISQNVDGLHRRSGVPPALLAELHGNTNLERCDACGKDYLREFHTREALHVFEHITTRKCSCGGPLKDTIINFGENLPERELRESFEHSEQADACIALGSSLTVTPAANCPKKVSKRGKELIICNLQRTPLDERATVRVFAKCDDLMRLVMQKLGIEIPAFKLHRRVKISTSVRPKLVQKANRLRLNVAALEEDGTPASIFRSVKVKFSNTQLKEEVLTEEPFQTTAVIQDKTASLDVKIKLIFFGHYAEPSLKLQHTVSLKPNEKHVRLIDCFYDPYTRGWEIEEVDQQS